MMHSKHMIMVGLASLALFPAEAEASYRYLCTSAPHACEYVHDDGNVPLLNSAVCHGRGIGTVLKGTAPCPAGSWPYQVIHGEVVNPLTGQVQAYVPLGSACDIPGVCVEWEPHDGGQESPICCDEWACYEWDGLLCPGTLYWCHDGVSNLDGTVTCFEAEDL